MMMGVDKQVWIEKRGAPGAPREMLFEYVEDKVIVNQTPFGQHSYALANRVIHAVFEDNREIWT
jgi:hypothetical protein